MALQMNGLGGFLRLGPQVYPARPNAAQVIMRGPHGMRLAQDPVLQRLKHPKGSGFQFWVEQMNVPADVSWNPPQKIVGLMGLGADVTAAYEQCDPALPKPVDKRAIPLRGSSAYRSIRADILRSSLAACHGRTAEARQILHGAWAKWADDLTLQEAKFLDLHVKDVDRYISQVEAAGPPAVQAARRRSEVRESQAQQVVRDYNMREGQEEARRSAEEIRCAKAGEGAYAQFIATGSCVTGDDLQNLGPKIDWKKVGLGVAGIVAVYGLASGFGRALVR